MGIKMRIWRFYWWGWAGEISHILIVRFSEDFLSGWYIFDRAGTSTESFGMSAPQETSLDPKAIFKISFEKSHIDGFKILTVDIMHGQFLALQHAHVDPELCIPYPSGRLMQCSRVNSAKFYTYDKAFNTKSQARRNPYLACSKDSTLDFPKQRRI